MAVEFAPSDTKSMSTDVTLFMPAYIEARNEFESADKSGSNTFQKSSYVTEKDIYDAINGALFKHKIGINHYTEFAAEGALILRTRLTHGPSGQYIETMLPVISEKPGNQGLGAALTYCRRYNLLSICALSCGRQDDDGIEEAKYIESRQNISVISAEELAAVNSLLDSLEKGAVLKRNILSFNKIGSLAELPANKLRSVLEYIKNN